MKRKGTVESETTLSSNPDGDDKMKKKANPLKHFMRIVTLAFLLVIGVHFDPTEGKIVSIVSRIFMGIFYIMGGVAHFQIPKFYVNLLPPWSPFRLPIIYVSGIIEIVLGVLVTIPRFTNQAAWLIIWLLLAVYPSNIYCAISKEAQTNVGIPQKAALIRLPIQFLFWIWSFQHTTLPWGETLQQIVKNFV